MSRHLPYILLSLIFLGLSLFGVNYLKSIVVVQPEPLVNDVFPIPTAAATATAVPTDISATMTLAPTVTPVTQTLTSDKYHFSLVYPSFRTLYEAAENGGTRFTLYSASGNITLHAGTLWSWTHPSRVFSTELLVSGQPTFVYRVPTQTIVDFQNGGINYTIQCVHKDIPSAVLECDNIISSFVLTS
ncbi:MAG: hypothetical protein WAV41_00975 [Microgenomates group bacterium]